jgi:uncharacterized DUF497 family protein
MRVREVRWPAGIRDKVEARHGLAEGQVEEAVLSAQAYIRRARESRYHVFGCSDDGAYVMAVIVYEGGVARIISARRMTQAERRAYHRRGK